MRTLTLLLCALLISLSSHAGKFNQSEISLVENPGNLDMKIYGPTFPRWNAPLVVLLHGCAQDPQSFVVDGGWKKFADKLGFYILMPAQKKENNEWACFNWFNSEDQISDSGEVKSITNMIEKMKRLYRIDDDKVFVAGLSAGGGMTSVMLATHPELFKSGAIAAGVPYKCATSVSSAYMCLFGFVTHSSETWATKVYEAREDYQGPYPTLSIWQGNNDSTVKPSNAVEVVKQWTKLHGVDEQPIQVTSVKGHQKYTYGSNGKIVVERYMLNNFEHAWPISPGNSQDNCGKSAKWVDDSGLCASFHILKYWGLL